MKKGYYPKFIRNSYLSTIKKITQSNLKMGKGYEEVGRCTEDKQAHGSAMLFRAKHLR